MVKSYPSSEVSVGENGYVVLKDVLEGARIEVRFVLGVFPTMASFRLDSASNGPANGVDGPLVPKNRVTTLILRTPTVQSAYTLAPTPSFF